MMRVLWRRNAARSCHVLPSSRYHRAGKAQSNNATAQGRFDEKSNCTSTQPRTPVKERGDGLLRMCNRRRQVNPNQPHQYPTTQTADGEGWPTANIQQHKKGFNTNHSNIPPHTEGDHGRLDHTGIISYHGATRNAGRSSHGKAG